MTIGERLYRGLLKLYPSSFRTEYEEPMFQLFMDQWRDAARRGKLLPFWKRIIWDLFRTLPCCHREHVLQGLALGFAFIVAGTGGYLSKRFNMGLFDFFLA